MYFVALARLNFLSINRFERKKNIDLAVSAFAMLHTLEENIHQTSNLADANLTIAGKFLIISPQVLPVTNRFCIWMECLHHIYFFFFLW